MQRGLGARWMGVLFAVILIVCFPIAFSSLQANTIQATIAGAWTARPPHGCRGPSARRSPSSWAW